MHHIPLTSRLSLKMAMPSRSPFHERGSCLAAVASMYLWGKRATYKEELHLCRYQSELSIYVISGETKLDLFAGLSRCDAHVCGCCCSDDWPESAICTDAPDQKSVWRSHAPQDK